MLFIVPFEPDLIPAPVQPCPGIIQYVCRCIVPVYSRIRQRNVVQIRAAIGAHTFIVIQHQLRAAAIVQSQLHLIRGVLDLPIRQHAVAVQREL